MKKTARWAVFLALSVSEAYSDVARNLNKRMVDGQEFRLARGLLKWNGHNVSVLYGDHTAVLLVDNEVCGSCAELGCQNAVIRARRAAALIVAGNGDTRLLSELGFDLSRDLVGYGRVLGLLAASAAFLFGEYLIVDALCTLGNGEDGKASAVAAAVIDCLQNCIYIIRYLRDEDYIRARAYTGVQRESARVAPHELDEEHSAVR